jgi:hypothetical protein
LGRLSNGEKIDMPAFLRASEANLATLQRARKCQRVKAIHAKIRDRRKDFLHEETTKLVRQYGFIAVGNVSPSKLARTNMAKCSQCQLAGSQDHADVEIADTRAAACVLRFPSDHPDLLGVRLSAAFEAESHRRPANKESGLATIAVRFMIVT